MSNNSYAYEIGGSLYLNITNRCTNSCAFCVRQLTDGLNGYCLWLDREPEYPEMLAAVADANRYHEVVFCGYGEPLFRPELIVEVARELKKQKVYVPINTNGQGDLINGYSVAPLLSGLIDAVSISLNAPDPVQYMAICKPVYGEKAYWAMLDFAKSCKEYIPEVTLSVVRLPGLDISKCRAIADSLQTGFRVREYS